MLSQQQQRDCFMYDLRDRTLGLHVWRAHNRRGGHQLLLLMTCQENYVNDMTRVIYRTGASEQYLGRSLASCCDCSRCAMRLSLSFWLSPWRPTQAFYQCSNALYINPHVRSSKFDTSTQVSQLTQQRQQKHKLNSMTLYSC